MTFKVYLDDERAAPEGWQRSLSVKDTIQHLMTGKVTHLSLDNDLGSLDPLTEGYNVLLWLEETIYNDRTFPMPEITIHSANAARVEYMKRALQSILNFKNKIR